MFRLATIALLLAAAHASAQQQPGPQSQPQEHRGPPQEAFDACKGKKEGDSAQMKTPRGAAMSGTCRMVLVPGRPQAERAPSREPRPPAK